MAIDSCWNRRFLLAILAFAGCPFTAPAQPPPTWLLVTAPAYRAALEPLCQHRQAQGFKVHVVQTTDVLTAQQIVRGEAGPLHEHVVGLARKSTRPVYLTLVGAVEAAELAEADRRTLPPLKGMVSRMKGQPSDHGYGDPDGDHLGRVAVGRLPVRDVDEARALVKKIIDFERDDRPGEWRRRLTLLAGVPEFNPLVDALVERLALSKLDRIDLAWSGRAIYHNPSSRFCLPDAELQPRALDYVQAGQLLTLYLGHSGPQGFWAGGAHYLDRGDWARLKIPAGKGIFATFGCYGCQLLGKDGEGYGLAALRNPDGPVAVIGAHGVCFAAMVQLAADGLFDAMLARRPPERLGDVWLAVQKHIARGELNPIAFRLLDAVDGDPRIPEPVQRREHLEMFLLLGDPALKLPMLADDLKLQVEGERKAGQTLRLRGEAPRWLEGAAVRITIERPLTSLPLDLAALPREGPERALVMQANHDRANRFQLEAQRTVVRNGLIEADLKLPDRLPWSRLTVRVYAATDRYEAAATLTIHPKE